MQPMDITGIGGSRCRHPTGAAIALFTGPANSGYDRGDFENSVGRSEAWPDEVEGRRKILRARGGGSSRGDWGSPAT